MGFDDQQCLTEKTDGKGIVFTFGRFTPPHSGHEVLINKVVSVAKKLGYENGIYASKSYGDARNPLKYKDKIKYLKGAFRNANIVDDASLFNPFVVAKHLSNEGYKNVVLVVGGDRATALERDIRKYIGHKDPTKSFDFDSFKVVSAGKRDPDADDVSGMSASKMRKSATEGDFDTFKAGAPSEMKERDIKKMYDKTREGLGVKESITDFFDGLDPYITEESLKEEAYRLLDNKNLSLLGLMEEEESKSEKPTIIVLTKFDEAGDYSDTTQKIEKACEHLDLSFYAISVDSAYVVDEDLDDDKITIHNYNGEDMKINLDVNNAVCIPRGSILDTYAGVGILSILQDTGMFTVNKVSNMELCQNKFATAIALERGKVNSPKTALVANEDAIDVALEKIGGKFPVVLKTITGAEGIGVSLIESEKSLKGVLQSLWKFDAEVIIQEYFEIEFDVRTIVLDGKIVASIKRNKGDSDFRTNKSLGNDTDPYTLNEEEKELVLKAAKTVGCYMCGVDHIVVDGGKEYKVLEVNGSPGSGADTYMGYLNEDEPSEISGQEMIDYVIEYVSDRDNWQISTKEVGVLEKIKIDGIDDEIDARIDTGNESYNVLHATNIDHDKKFNTVEFTSMGKDFDLPFAGTVTIDMGQDNIEKRPVVKMDMKLGSKLYKDVKFSLSDRDGQDYEVLIGKKFLQRANLSVNVSKTYELQEEINKLNREFIGSFLSV